MARRQYSPKDSRVAELDRRLVAAGLRHTRQRSLLLELVTSGVGSGHFTADRLIAEAKVREPHINKTTIYRTLEALAALGLVSMIDLGGNHLEYELLNVPHHHLVCKECGSVAEIPDTSLDSLRALIQEQHGFQPCFDHFALHGVCPNCLAKQGEQPSQRPN